MLAGCNMARSPMQPDIQQGQDVSIERIRISALTEFVTDSARSDKVQLKVVLELFDAIDSSVPMPCR